MKLHVHVFHMLSRQCVLYYMFCMSLGLIRFKLHVHVHTTLSDWYDYLGFGRGASPCFRHANLRWLSICTVHSSLQITLSKVSWRCSLAQASHLPLFTSRINWQYALPLKVQPKAVRHLRIVRRQTEYPLSVKRRCSWWAVVSSSSLIWSSTICLISAVILDGLPDPTFLPIKPVAW